MSTGMPRPLSTTVTLLSSCTVTLISSQKPAIASSTELSTTSQTRWCRPSSPVEPMYIAGRLRTASIPPRTLIEVASYLWPFGGSFSAITFASPQIRTNQNHAEQKERPTKVKCLRSEDLSYIKQNKLRENCELLGKAVGGRPRHLPCPLAPDFALCEPGLEGLLLHPVPLRIFGGTRRSVDSPPRKGNNRILEASFALARAKCLRRSGPAGTTVADYTFYRMRAEFSRQIGEMRRCLLLLFHCVTGCSGEGEITQGSGAFGPKNRNEIRVGKAHRGHAKGRANRREPILRSLFRRRFGRTQRQSMRSIFLWARCQKFRRDECRGRRCAQRRGRAQP